MNFIKIAQTEIQRQTNKKADVALQWLGAHQKKTQAALAKARKRRAELKVIPHLSDGRKIKSLIAEAMALIKTIPRLENTLDCIRRAKADVKAGEFSSFNLLKLCP